MHQILSSIFALLISKSLFPPISNFIILNSFSCTLFRIQTLFSRHASHLNPFLSITINHLAFKDKRRARLESYTLRVTQDQAVGALGWSFKDVSSATLLAAVAALSQWRLLLCCLSVRGGGCCWYEKRPFGPPGDTKLLLTNKRINTSRMGDLRWYIFIAHFETSLFCLVFWQWVDTQRPFCFCDTPATRNVQWTLTKH